MKIGHGWRRLNRGADVITGSVEPASFLSIFKGLYLVIQNISIGLSCKLKEGYEQYLYKNPSRNRHIYLAKSSCLSVMIDDVIGVPSVSQAARCLSHTFLGNALDNSQATRNSTRLRVVQGTTRSPWRIVAGVARSQFDNALPSAYNALRITQRVAYGM